MTEMCAVEEKWTYYIAASQLIDSLTPFIRVVQKHCLVCSRTIKVRSLYYGVFYGTTVRHFSSIHRQVDLGSEQDLL